ncbi:hypothetical protein AABM36_08430 [Kocuria sp. KSNUG]|uniref:hypothetical protein n=1 Tax=Kocuria sp. KSNUG TaxID=3136676 RepID=UPI003C2FEF4A
MKPIIRDRARAAFTQLREDLAAVAPTFAYLLRVAADCIVPTSRTIARRVYRAWEDGCPSAEVRRDLERRGQEGA